MSVVTRFAPSPTGFLHIGGVRTALFNWLYARHHRGTFLLRIEDTDRARSTDEAVEAILDGLRWMGLAWQGEPVFQSQRCARHQEVARLLVAQGQAYYCYCTPEELEHMKDQARAEGRPPLYDGRWRDRSPEEAPPGVKPVVRLKVHHEGYTTLKDEVQGEVQIRNTQLDDMILLRSDGTPTYMLSVVVDDHDMGVTHVIRGDDHLTNAFRQIQIYRAMGWDIPEFAHIPLIHGPDGAKLSKRHGALGVEAYRAQGFLPQAMMNYLLRLGWSHGDDEIISRDQAISWFDLSGVGRSPSRFDLQKLTALNAHYLRETSNSVLVDLVCSLLGGSFSEAGRYRFERGMDLLKMRAKTLIDLGEGARIYLDERVQKWDEKARKLLTRDATDLLVQFTAFISGISEASWSAEVLEEQTRLFLKAQDLPLKEFAPLLRAVLTGRMISPPLFDVLEVLGKSLVLDRLMQVRE